MPPDKELDGVHECKWEECEGGSDEVEQGERGEDQVGCQLVMFWVADHRKNIIRCVIHTLFTNSKTLDVQFEMLVPVYECEESGKGHEKGDRGEGEVSKCPQLCNPTKNFDLSASDCIDCLHKRHLPCIQLQNLNKVNVFLISNRSSP